MELQPLARTPKAGRAQPASDNRPQPRMTSRSIRKSGFNEDAEMLKTETLKSETEYVDIIP